MDQNKKLQRMLLPSKIQPHPKLTVWSTIVKAQIIYG